MNAALHTTYKPQRIAAGKWRVASWEMSERLGGLEAALCESGSAGDAEFRAYEEVHDAQGQKSCEHPKPGRRVFL
jgi:hypothetical protein